MAVHVKVVERNLRPSERAQRVLEFIRKRKEELLKSIAELEREIEAKRSMIAEIKNYARMNQSDVEEAEKLLAEIEKLKREVDELEARLRQLLSEKSDIERQLQEVQKVKAALDEKRRQLEGILSKYEEMVSKYAGVMSGPYEEMVSKYAGAMAGSTPFGPRPGTRPKHVPL